MVRSKKAPTRRSDVPKKNKSFNMLQVGRKQFKVGKTTLKAIKRLQYSTKHCIPGAPFCRVIREILQDISQERRDWMIQSSAIKALQESAEMYLVTLFEDGNMAAGHADRITVTPKDFKLVFALRGSRDGCYH